MISQMFNINFDLDDLADANGGLSKLTFGSEEFEVFQFWEVPPGDGVLFLSD